MQLLLDCIRVGREPSTQELAARAAAVGDWKRFLWLANEHRVFPFVAARLDGNPGVPAEIRARLAQRYQQIAMWNMHQSRVLLDALACLQAAGVPTLCFKGPILAQKLYGGVGNRQFRDIDILVPRQQALEAVACLQQQGFVWSRPVPQDQLPEVIRLHKDIEMERDGVVVEVHWELMGPRFGEQARTDSAWAAAEDELLMGQPVSVLAARDELAYLVLHGSKHYFKRLLWLLDIALILEASDAQVRADLEQDARDGAFRRRLDLSLALASDLLGSPAEAPSLDRRTRRLLRRNCSWLLREKSFDIGVARLLGFQARSFDRRLTGAGYLASALLKPTLADRPAATLPAPLGPLRYVARPLRLAYSQSRRLLVGPRR